MKSFEIISLAGIVTVIAGISIAVQSPSRPIIYASFVDVSESALNYKFPNGQIYNSLMKDNCLFSLDSLEKNDIYIEGKYSTEVDSNSHVINYLERNRLKDTCDRRTDPGARMRQQGTSLKVAIERLEQEIKMQRTQKINFPIAATIAIDATEPQPGKPSENLNSTIAKIKTMVSQENLRIALVGSEVKLQQQLKDKLGDINGVEFGSLNDIDTVTEKVIQSARKLQPVK